ncbi:MAG: acyl-CoA dehydrogenase family protein [Nitrospiria bacterium]
MDFNLSHEQRLIRETARRFTIREAVEREEHPPKEILKKMGSEGLLGGPIPIAYGGGGCDAISYTLFLEEIGRHSSSLRSAVSVQISLVALSILRWGSENQKGRFLPQLCSGEQIGCFGLTEQEAGSDVASMATLAEKKGSDWSINGIKTFITNGGIADLALVFAQTDPALGTKGLAAFLVDRRETLFVSKPIKGKLGLKASDTSEILFDNAIVPGENLLGKVGEGFLIAMHALDQGRLSVAAGCVGILEGCLDASIRHAKKRRQFDQPIGRFQLIQEMLAQMKVDADAARFLVYRAAFLKDAGLPNTAEVSIAKLFASEAALRAANDTVQIFGSTGFLDETAAARYYRDAKATTIYEGTSQIQKLIIGRHLTGLRAFG